MACRPRPWRSALAWAALFLLAAQLATTAVLEWRYPDFLDPKYGWRMAALRRLRQRQPERELLAVLGSSRAEQGFRPAIFADIASDKTPLFYNLARGGSSPLLYLLTLRRMLADGVRPDALLVEIFPPALVEEGDGVVIFKPTLRDWPLLRRYSVSRETWACWLYDRLLFWHKYRSGLLAALAPAWLSRQARWGDNLWNERGGEWRRIGTGAASAERRRLIDDARQRYFASLQHFHIGADADRALRELLELCRQQRIGVHLFLMPEASEFRGWYPAEARRHLMDYLTQLRRDFDVPLIDARTWIDDSDFSDGHHLLQRGATAFTLRFAALILFSRRTLPHTGLLPNPKS